MARETIHISQLKVGLFIHLDLDWSEHPFMFRAFRIKNQQQINTLKKLGLTEIVYDPTKSKVAPGDVVAVEEKELVTTEDDDEPIIEAEAIPDEEDSLDEAMQEKQKRVEQLRERRKSLQKSEKAFTESAKAVKNLMADLRARPREALAQADTIVGDMLENAFDDREVTMQLVNMHADDDSTYYHSINVMMLSLLLGKELGLSELEMRHLGVGAMLHDFGHMKIPDKILRKSSPLTEPEKKVYQAHARYGAELARKIGTFAEPVIDIVEHHHEREDGSGFPDGLVGYEISKLSKIVAIADAYDELCNGAHSQQAMTPHESMSFMYGRQKGKFDERILAILISRMGVYPPGTIVRLSDDRIAGVTAVNPKNLLKPQVLIYDRYIPREEAVIMYLDEDDDLSIVESLRRSEVPSDMLAYLNFSNSVNYFAEQK